MQNKSCVFFRKLFSHQWVFCIFGCPGEIAIKRDEPPFSNAMNVSRKKALFAQYVQ